MENDALAMKRKILLCVSGLSPQVVTETVYALSRRQSPFIPDEIHLITTAEGAERAKLQLLSDPPGWLSRLREEYSLPPIRMDSDTIHVLHDAHGRPLSDIRTPEDNEAAADGILDIVRRLTSDDAAVLHVSIAGGRKAMGFFVGYALSLYGRDCDEMSHVLVESPYESLRDFFYPSRKERIIYTRDERPLDAARARVWLATIPFVRMRDGIPENLRSGRATYSEVVRAAARRFAAPGLTLLVRTRTVRTPLGKFQLSPALFAFYWWLVERRLNGEKGVTCPAEGVPDATYASEVLDRWVILTNDGLRGHQRTREGLRDGMSKAYFERSKSRINKIIRTSLNTSGSPYEIIRGRDRRGNVFGLLRMPAENIEVSE